MTEHTAEIHWKLDGDFAAGRYSRGHEIRLDGGITLPGSASPHVVPLPHSVAEAIDPEEAFVAALAACHMLWFLDHARRAGHVLRAYTDRARGQMARNPQGKFWISEVTLTPRVTWEGVVPAPTEVDLLHHQAHEDCFIANSVRTSIRIEPG